MSINRRRAVSFVGFAGAALAGRAWAAVPIVPEPVGRPLAFSLLRNDSPIGTHRVNFWRSGPETVVEAVTAIEVRVAFVTVYRYHQTIRQAWRDGRLQTLDSRTDDNGEVRTVTARPAAAGLAVDGPLGRSVVPAETVPTGFWNRRVVGQTQLLDSSRGKMLTVAVVPAGKRTFEIDGRGVEADIHRMSGDISAEIAFTTEGEWVGLVLTTRSNRVTYVWTRPTETSP